MEEPSPHAPWALAGEAIVALVRRRGESVGPLAHGLKPMPGPAVVVAVNYQTSPIGPFCELSVLEPVRLGARPGWSVTVSVVNDSRARSGGRLNWGFPRELGTLVWRSDGHAVTLSWAERQLRLTCLRRRGAMGVVVPLRALQHRSDGQVVVPLRLRGVAHRATVTIDGGDGDLSRLAGSHPGALIASARLALRPAGHPAGLVRMLAAPVRPPPEPGVAGFIPSGTS